MMAPDAPEPPSRGPAQQPAAALAQALAAGFGVAHAGVPLRWPDTIRRACSPSPRRDSDDESSGEESDSSLEGESSRVQSQIKRGRVEKGDSDGSRVSDASSDAGSECSEEDAEEAAEAPEAAVVDITANQVAERAAEMFVIESSGPKEVREPLLAPTMTKQLVKHALEVANAVCDRDGKALSRSFGNFDRRVALGWLLADAVGLPLVNRAQAHAIGIKAQREAGYIKDAIKTTRKEALAAARSAGADDPRAAQDDAEARLLREPAGDIALPQRAAKPTAKPPSGSRKRARQAEPSRDELVAHAEGRILKAEKEVKRAEAQEARADTAQEAALEKLEALNATLALAMDNPESMSDAKFQLQSKRADAAQVQCLDAQLAARDAEIELLRAQLETSEAENALLLLQWGHMCETLDTTLELASEGVRSMKDHACMLRSAE